MGKHVWGYWDCDYCGSKQIRGDNTECPHCGHARDQTVKFYMREDVLEYVPPEKEKKEQNWICSYCNNQNKWNDMQCSYCGAERKEASGTYFQNDIPPGLEEKNSFEALEEDVAEEEPPPSSPITSPKISTQSSDERYENKTLLDTLLSWLTGNWKRCAGIFFGVVAIISLIWLFTPVTRTARIDHFSWEREIQVEQYKTVEESGWSIPSGGRLRYTTMEIHHYDKVLDHYEKEAYQVHDHDEVSYSYRDLGNGQFEQVEHRTPVYRTEYRDTPVYRNDPVYATKYHYEIERWKYDRSLNSAGMDKEPYWADTSALHNDGKAGSERESSRKEHYYIHSLSDDEIKVYEVSYRDWVSLEKGQEIKFKTFRFDDKALGDIEFLQ